MKWALLLIAVLVSSARADSLTLSGSPIPIECRIEGISDGRVYYRGERGRRAWHELGDVVAIDFDVAPQVADAEAILQDDPDRGLRALLSTLADVADPLPRSWLLVRLVRFHNERREYAPAIAHLATLCRDYEDAGWIALAPAINPALAKEMGITLAPMSYPQVAEARHNVESARARVQTRGLRSMLDAALPHLRELESPLRAAWTGTPWKPGTTLSGIALGDLGSSAPRAEVPPEPKQPAAPVSGSIDDLLEAGQYTAALRACEAAAQDPGDDPAAIARLLFQYAAALRGADRPRDAVVMYTRCAILYEDESPAAAAWLGAALIHRDIFADGPTAVRLARRAADVADGRGQRELAERATAFADALGER